MKTKDWVSFHWNDVKKINWQRVKDNPGKTALWSYVVFHVIKGCLTTSLIWIPLGIMMFHEHW